MCFRYAGVLVAFFYAVHMHVVILSVDREGKNSDLRFTTSCVAPGVPFDGLASF